jgi:hypothetical protein
MYGVSMRAAGQVLDAPAYVRAVLGVEETNAAR